MVYCDRLCEKRVKQCFKAFPCVVITGARQVGKSTLLDHLFGSKIRSFTFDPVQDTYGEKSDPDLFLRNNPPPLILDEIQNAPELASALKRRIDADRKPGQYLLTGSQQWGLMRVLAESLAGRTAVLELPPFALTEGRRNKRLAWFADWLESQGRKESAKRADRRLLSGTSAGIPAIEAVWRGGFPEVREMAMPLVSAWMQGYVATYLMRDVRVMLAVRDERQFARFAMLCAALTAQEVNASQLGRDAGLSTPTALNWLSTLSATCQWREVSAYSRNAVKRVSLKPKGYLADTGLACYLLRLPSPEALLGYPNFGALFETFVVNELARQTQTLPVAPVWHHYRQHSGREVDLIAEYGGRLHPVEIKAASSVRPADAAGIAAFQHLTGTTAGTGLVVYAGDRPLRLGDHCLAVPFDLLTGSA